jgi:hypothetical protein
MVVKSAERLGEDVRRQCVRKKDLWEVQLGSVIGHFERFIVSYLFGGSHIIKFVVAYCLDPRITYKLENKMRLDHPIAN